jgi:hypothetical protein
MKIIDSDCVWYMDVSCLVRNEINGWRPNPKKKPADEVVYAITKNNTRTLTPVMPRQFPVGIWKITTIENRFDRYRKPFIILTDAFQELEEWKLDGSGGYDKPTGDKILDYQYGLHFSQYNTTQGCIKVHDVKDLMRLSKSINKEFQKNNTPLIEVSE